jgi:IS5 family transposase
MQPKKQISSPQLDMFRNRLESILNHRHELYRLSGLIDREVFESEFGKLYSEEGRPSIPIRLLVGLTYLSHAFNTSDEETVRRWVENPYHQYFCGEEYFRHELPINPSSLSRWRKRIGEQGSESILKLTVQAGLASGAVAPASLERVIVDTTVQEKAVAFPTTRGCTTGAASGWSSWQRRGAFVFGRVAPALVSGPAEGWPVSPCPSAAQSRS